MGIPSKKHSKVNKAATMRSFLLTLLAVIGSGSGFRLAASGTGTNFERANSRIPFQRIPNNCVTQQTGATCVFPFKYKNVEYFKCTFADSPQASWCATRVDPSGNVITNNWGDCVLSQQSGCQEESTTSTSTTSTTTTPPTTTTTTTTQPPTTTTTASTTPPATTTGG